MPGLEEDEGFVHFHGECDFGEGAVASGDGDDAVCGGDVDEVACVAEASAECDVDVGVGFGFFTVAAFEDTEGKPPCFVCAVGGAFHNAGAAAGEENGFALGDELTDFAGELVGLFIAVVSAHDADD